MKPALYIILGIVIGAGAASMQQSVADGPAAADIAELRREKMMMRLCEDAIREQQAVKRGPYEAHPHGDRCAVYQHIFSGGG